MQKLIQIFLLIICLTVFKNEVYAQQPEIGEITVERHRVYDSTMGDWFFAAPFLNSLHGLTKEHLITDEILVEEGDELDTLLLQETERNLRLTELFTEAYFVVLDTFDDGSVHLHLVTQDRWSTVPSPIASYKAGIRQFGGRFEESNLFGYGTNIRAEVVHTNRNNTGLQGDLTIFQRRIFRSELNVGGRIFANKYKTIQNLNLTKPFRAISTEWAWNLTGANSFGSDFLFKNGTTDQLFFKEKFGQAWLSRKWLRESQVFVSGYVSGERNEREQRLAFDNSGRALVAFSSLKQNFLKDKWLNGYQDEDVVTGGWGTVVLGKVFPIAPGGDNMVYVGARAEQSVLLNDKRWYLFGQMTAGSGFGQGRPQYTYQEFAGKTYYRFSPTSVISTQIRQQTAWNWSALRQLVLDNQAGLRGYAANELAGENRIIINSEWRYFAQIPVWFFRFSGALFYDVGTVWNQTDKLHRTRWHHSAGPGLRFHTTTGGSLLLAADLPYNFDTKKINPVLSSTYAFSIFDTHIYEPPQIFGEEYDLE